MNRFLIGLDAGTTSFKAALFDENLRLIASKQADYTLSTPKAGWVEYPAESYYECMCGLIRALLADAAIDPEAICAIAISSQGETLICVDDNGAPIGEAIVWLDNRATAEADELRALFGRRAVYEISGQADMVATWPAAKILWLARNEPERFARTARFLLLEDYLIYRLTGKFCCEPNLWASSAMLNIHTAQWWPEMLDALAIGDNRLPAILPCGAPVGPVCAAAQADTGLAGGTLVATGALDQTCNTIGAGITRPGAVCETTGSCLAVSAALPNFVPYREGEWITCQNHAVPGRYTVLLWSQSAGMTFKWFAKQFYPEFPGDLDAAFAAMNGDALSVPAGSEGVVMLPHLTGASNPEYDLNATGAFFGVTLEHGRAHFTRAIMEAVAYMLRRNLEQIEKFGARFDRLCCMGGGAKSPVWLSIKASATGKIMQPVAVEESACRGAAILAGVGVGVFADIDSAASTTVTDRIAPDGKQKSAYDRGYQNYIALYEALKPLFAKVAQERKEFI